MRAHYLWEDVDIIQGNDSIWTSCKIMIIHSHSRGKKENSFLRYPLDKNKVDMVPTHEPMSLLLESRYTYLLILCDI